MKKPLPLLGLLLSLSWHAFAQSNAVFFSDEGEKFTLLLNGVKQNATPEANVRVTNLNGAPYQVRIEFADAALGTVNDKVYLELGTERTYTVKKKVKTEAGKNLRTAGRNIGKNVGLADNKAPVKDEFYVIRLLSTLPIGGGQGSASGTGAAADQAAPARTAESGSAASNSRSATSQSTAGKGTSHSTTTTTTVRTEGEPEGESENVNMSISMPVGSMNVNMNASSSATSSHSSSSTVTRTSSGGGNSRNAAAATPAAGNQSGYVLSGYNGPYGCPSPMLPQDFEHAKQSIQNKDFENSRLEIAKQVANSNCLLASQVRELMQLFDFEPTRLEFAKHAYHHTLDTGNYFKVNDLFDFEASVTELTNYVNQQRR